MKYIAEHSVEVEPNSIYMKIPVFYDEKDIPNNFPFRTGGTQEISFTPNGQIIGWGEKREKRFAKNQNNQSIDSPIFDFCMKVCDDGYYEVRNPAGEAFLTFEGGYVPHSFIIGNSGDYIDLKISSNKKILNLSLNMDQAFKDARLNDNG
jgi:hypothetical protein